MFNMTEIIIVFDGWAFSSFSISNVIIIIIIQNDEYKILMEKAQLAIDLKIKLPQNIASICQARKKKKMKE